MRACANDTHIQYFTSYITYHAEYLTDSHKFWTQVRIRRGKIKILEKLKYIPQNQALNVLYSVFPCNIRYWNEGVRK